MTRGPAMTICSDNSLAQRLERTEARANAAFVETRARLEPDSGACWIDVGGTYAMFDGPESPITQTFGLGMFSETSDDDLAELETFFSERGAPTNHEVSPFAGAELIAKLCDAGYRPIELTSVMFLELGTDRPKRALEAIATRIAEPSEADVWAATSAKGWSTEAAELEEFMRGFGFISANCDGGFPYLAEIDGVPAAAGMLFLFDGVALLAGASTVSEYRRRGVQSALLADRLDYAAERGCRIAMMCASPGSQSQRNAEKNGFRIAYTRTKWLKA